ncbi:hypothetical protein [Actinoallomurus vinaceus]
MRSSPIFRKGRPALPAVLTVSALTVGVSLTGTPARAATPPVSHARILAHLDLAAGAQPENIALEPDGSADLTYGFSGRVARVDRTGRVSVIAQVPIPADGDVPLTHGKIFLGGIVRLPGGARYVAVSTGTAQGTGVYRLRAGRAPVRVAALSPGAFLNGMAYDRRTRRLFVADSAQGRVWSLSPRGGAPAAWAGGSVLASRTAGGFGANGLKVRGGSVWVSNLDAGTLVHVPITRNGAAGRPAVAAKGLGPVDDFAFTGRGTAVLAAVNQENKVVLVDSRGTAKTVLTAADGLSNPTSVAVRGRTVYIADAAYFTRRDPNLLVARLRR